ncbi:hypothetical protein GCM10023320_49840 [Pseudonocardia adelaidensis]|uniref:Uncharacterized protein n=1 Tax=Pseudonocardia adelaidensis TaxID=648754 RepID=A0ABP9NP30_9PSEU
MQRRERERTTGDRDRQIAGCADADGDGQQLARHVPLGLVLELEPRVLPESGNEPLAGLVEAPPVPSDLRLDQQPGLEQRVEVAEHRFPPLAADLVADALPQPGDLLQREPPVTLVRHEEQLVDVPRRQPRQHLLPPWRSSTGPDLIPG